MLRTSLPQTFPPETLSLDELVSKNHLVRKIYAAIDFEFIREINLRTNNVLCPPVPILRNWKRPSMRIGRQPEKSLKPALKERQRKTKVSTSDPDSGFMHRTHKPKGFFYLDRRTVDGQFGIITDTYSNRVMSTTASLLSGVWRVNWRVFPSIPSRLGWMQAILRLRFVT